MRVPTKAVTAMAVAVLLAGAAPEARAQAARAADTLHLEVGSPRVNGGVYRPHAGRVVKLRVAGGRTDTTAVWTNRLVIGDSSGRAVHRWHTAGWGRQPGGARGSYDLWSTFDARTLALLGWHLKTEKGFEVRLGADGRAVRGTRRTPADSTPVPIDTTLPRAGFAAGAADLIPYAVGLREGVVMTLPLWSPPGAGVKTEVWRVTRRTPVEFAGRRVPSWEMEHYRPEDGRLLGRIWFIDEPPYVARWDLFHEDGATDRMISEPVRE